MKCAMLEGQGQMEAQYKVSCEYTPVPVGHDGLFSQFGTVRKGPVGYSLPVENTVGEAP
jgi:hypothetical protein